jgi:hypothetical protein
MLQVVHRDYRGPGASGQVGIAIEELSGVGS